MQEEWELEKLKLKKLEYENSEASRKLKTEIEELRKVHFKELEENLKQALEHVEKLSDNVKYYEELYQESQESLSAIKRDLSDPITSFLKTPEMEFDPNNPLNPTTHLQVITIANTTRIMP